MNRSYFLFFTALIILHPPFQSFGQIIPIFEDDFDSYVPGQQLACQNPVDWTTWNNMSCSPIEDPYISNNHAYNGLNSCVIVQNNDLVKLYDNLTSGTWYMDFQVYIPIGKAGYFNNLSDFTFGTGGYWAMEVYFDAGGTGRLITDFITNFTWTQNIWQHVRIKIDLNSDEAQFWLAGSLIKTWQWTSGGMGPLALEATDFFGATANDEMYIDNFQIGDLCLSCYPPAAPGNLTAQTIYNPDPQVQLNWQDNSWNENVFYILRKNGLPIEPTGYQVIGSVNVNITQFLDANVLTDSTYTYGIQAYNQFGYSDTSNFATITVEPVPVELISFTYEVQKENVILFWQTATETNNSGYEIERKPISNSDWVTIGFVPGFGTTTEPKSYSFLDKNITAGIYKYRLKQIDYDGSFEYSDEVEIDVTGPLTFDLAQNYPNPFNPSTSIKYSVPESGNIRLSVFNIVGEEVAVLAYGFSESGFFEVTFDASNLPSGTYISKLQSANSFQTIKMMLLK